MTKAIPERYHTVTPSFTFKNSEKAIEFYKKAFGAELVDQLPMPDGKGTMHATMQIGGSMIMMGDEMSGEQCAKSAETVGTSPISFYIYVKHVDAAFKQAVDAGGIVTMPVADMFWGDRVGQIKDPFGYLWMIATHKEDLNKEQIKEGAAKFFAQFQK
jgi:uncharacterized glyoxalase superfamily protein PhnB